MSQKTNTNPQRLEDFLNGKSSNTYWINNINLRRKEDKTKKESLQIYTPTAGRISIRANSLATNQHGNQEITPKCIIKPPEELILADLTFNQQKAERSQSKNDGEKIIENIDSNSLKKRPHRFLPSSLCQDYDQSKSEKREVMHTSPIQNRNRNQVDNHINIPFCYEIDATGNTGIQNVAEIDKFSDALSKELIDRCQPQNKVRSSSGTPLSDKKKMWISKTRRPTREEFSDIDVSLPGSSLSNKITKNDKIKIKSGQIRKRDDSSGLENLYDSQNSVGVEDKSQELSQMNKTRTQNVALIEQNNMTFYPRQQQKQQNLTNEHIRRRIFDEEELELHNNLFKKSNLSLQNSNKACQQSIPNTLQHTFVIQKNGYAVLQRNEAGQNKLTKKTTEDKKDKLFSQIEDQLLIKPFSLHPRNAVQQQQQQLGKDKTPSQQNTSKNKEINENILSVGLQQTKNEKECFSSDDTIGISNNNKKKRIIDEKNKEILGNNYNTQKDSKEQQIQEQQGQEEGDDIFEQTGRFGKQPEEDQFNQQQQQQKQTKLQEYSEQTAIQESKSTNNKQQQQLSQLNNLQQESQLQLQQIIKLPSSQQPKQQIQQTIKSLTEGSNKQSNLTQQQQQQQQQSFMNLSSQSDQTVLLSSFCAITSPLAKLNPPAPHIPRNTPSNYERQQQQQQLSQFQSQKQQSKQYNIGGDLSLMKFDDEDFCDPNIMHIPLITTKKQIRNLNCATSTKNNGRQGTLLSNYDFPLAEIVTTPQQSQQQQQQQQQRVLAGWRKYDFYQEKNTSNNNNNNNNNNNTNKFNNGFQFLGLDNSHGQILQQEYQPKQQQQQHRAKSSSNRFPREIFTPNVEKAKRLNSQCQPTRQPSLSAHWNS